MTRFLSILVSFVISTTTLAHATPVLRRAPTEAPHIEGRPWILGLYGADVDYQRMSLFKTKFYGVKIGPEITTQYREDRRTQLAIVSNEEGTLAKGFLYEEDRDKWEATAELKALEATSKSTDVAAGTISDWPVQGAKRFVILMKIVEGEDIFESNCYKKAAKDREKLDNLNQQLYNKLHNVVYQFAKEKQILHAGNLRITFSQNCRIKRVTLIDWGYPGIFIVKRGLSPEDFEPMRVEEVLLLVEGMDHVVVSYGGADISLVWAYGTNFKWARYWGIKV
ncbi:hypothetical protein EV368DRAFT_67806 [Lentinula lateritia]|uniref:Uncharacterized protein n=1 Tax=Lentinula aff. lateritia TaxID=2804960 RepID=A0ACC1TYC4_9AGAR|nr:hypothetical protein F5876DRAFT_66442 [Lentinula aff. lateritia]KAJ3848996.1 hypothetical protein EV368DRAFT_67806 [Lentinula lateritia]